MTNAIPAERLSLRRLLAALSVLAVLLLAPAAGAMEIQEVRGPRSGITAWLVEDHAVPIIAMNFSFYGGAAHDPEDRQGLAAFLAAMLDEGAGDMKSAEFQRRMEDLAMQMSFSAGMEHFTGSFRTITRNRDAAFRLLALALQRPRFDPVPLERIRRQLIIALRNSEERPQRQAFKAFKKILFGNHPYARSTKGTEAGLRAVTADDLRRLHARLFARDKLLVTVAGDIDAATLSALLDETFAPLPARSGMPEIPAPVIPKKPETQIIDRPVPQTQILMGHEGPRRDDPDFIAAYVVNHVLGNGAASRLNREVRERRGLAYSVYSALFAWRKAGVFFAHAGTSNARAAETLRIMKAEIARMAKEGPTPEELEEAKLYLTGSYPLRFDSTTKIASALLAIRRDGLGIDYVNRRNDLIRAVTVEKAREVARRLYHPDRLRVILLGQPEGLKQAPQRADGRP
jgi:zinc protease